MNSGTYEFWYYGTTNSKIQRQVLFCKALLSFYELLSLLIYQRSSSSYNVPESVLWIQQDSLLPSLHSCQAAIKLWKFFSWLPIYHVSKWLLVLNYFWIDNFCTLLRLKQHPRKRILIVEVLSETWRLNLSCDFWYKKEWNKVLRDLSYFIVSINRDTDDYNNITISMDVDSLDCK